MEIIKNIIGFFKLHYYFTFSKDSENVQLIKRNLFKLKSIIKDLNAYIDYDAVLNWPVCLISAQMKVKSFKKIIRNIGELKIIFNRSMPQHITTSAIVVNTTKTKFAIIHHKYLDAWIFPGGHAEMKNKTLLEDCVMEAREELGIDVEIPTDLGCIVAGASNHVIPENKLKNEGCHVHLDVTYVLYAKSDEFISGDPGILAAGWVRFDDENNAVNFSVRDKRMIEFTKELLLRRNK